MLGLKHEFFRQIVTQRRIQRSDWMTEYRTAKTSQSEQSMMDMNDTVSIRLILKAVKTYMCKEQQNKYCIV